MNREMQNVLSTLAKNPQKGFTLVEALIAAVIVVIVSALALNAFLVSSSLSIKGSQTAAADKNLDMMIATGVADSGIEVFSQDVMFEVSSSSAAQQRSLPIKLYTYKDYESGKLIQIFRHD